MAFPDGYLNEGEELVLNLKPHWWVFSQSAALLVAALAAAVVLNVIDVQYVGWFGWALLLAAILNLGVVYAKWTATYFLLSSDRLIFRTGVVTKRGVELPIGRIDNINFRQGLFERMIGAGDLLIESAGESGQSSFSNVRKPDAIQNEIYRQIERQADRRSGVIQHAPATETDVAAKILQLEELRKKGLVSEEEFEAKRRDLLDRM
ncbi:MAG: PH domain-containing protein [Actinomycetia bacterium]|nr:PH domain-containing protein [Actinomycetes bacterium]MCP4960574.1 PH domain-containing protein [Actinomycetes bacterium]